MHVVKKSLISPITQSMILEMMNLLYELKLSLKNCHSWPKLWQEIYHLFFQGGKQTCDYKCLLLHDRTFIVKDICMIHQPTLETKYKINKESGLHQSPLGEEILNIKCFNKCRFHILWNKSWSQIVFSGTVHWFCRRQAFNYYCSLHQVWREAEN